MALFIPPKTAAAAPPPFPAKPGKPGISDKYAAAVKKKPKAKAMEPDADDAPGARSPMPQSGGY